jgi:methanogenic corrinoid protein MtbC1
MTIYMQDGTAQVQQAMQSGVASDAWGSDANAVNAAMASTGQSQLRQQSGERLSQLVRAIEQEIIPRLMLAHRMSKECSTINAMPGSPIGPKEVKEFAKLVLEPNEDLAFACVEALTERGVAVDSIYLDLLAPTARYLGELWDQDLCDFTDVTVGLGRLQRVLRELSPAFARGSEEQILDKRVLLLPSPGEQHTFGLVMVGEFFRRAGWNVSGGAWESGSDAAGLVAEEWFDVVGFSLGSEIHLEQLADCIRTVRQCSRNRNIGVMVGGPLFALNVEFAHRVGADMVANDGREAPMLAMNLVTASLKT